MIRSAGIIAAGEGRRLKEGGIKVQKPMAPVANFPLIGHLLRRFAEFGIRRVVIIFNEQERDCSEWVQRNFPTLDLEILIKSTRSSFESFWRVGRALGPGRHLICTVDSICSARDLEKMIRLNGESAEELFLGVTSFVHDEKPLWIRTEPGSPKIVELGGRADTYATAGFYNAPSAIFDRELSDDISSLRVFLRELVREGFPATAVPLGEVIDVDTIEDLHLAEEFMSHRGRSL